MKIRYGGTEDLESLCSFYDSITDHQKYDEFSPRWTKDVYPTGELIKEMLEHERFYVGEEDGRIVCACCASTDNGMYDGAPWKVEKDAVILHLMASDPSCRRRGVSTQLLEYMLRDLKKACSSVHLDVCKGNLTAFRLYERCGFQFVGEKEVYYEDTGLMIVDLMEYVL